MLAYIGACIIRNCNNNIMYALLCTFHNNKYYVYDNCDEIPRHIIIITVVQRSGMKCVIMLMYDGLLSAMLHAIAQASFR